MTSPETTVLRKVAMSVLTRRGGSGADAAAVAATAARAYDDLATVLVPLIGQVGVDALTGRAFHMVQREYPWGEAQKEQSAGPFGQVSLWLERQDPALATDAAAAMLATFAGLLAAFIGEPLTTRFLRKAWPDAFSDTRSEETRA